MGSNGTIGIVVRVSDVGGRDKTGDRFISPTEQARAARTYCEAAGYDVLVIEPQDLNVPHKTPLEDRPAMGEALRMVERGTLTGIAVSSQDRIGPLMLTRELKLRLLAAGGVLKVADNPSAEVLDAAGYAKLPSEYMSLMHEAQREEIGLRWAAARRNAADRGVYPFREPFGYRRDADARVVIDDAAADVVRDAFRLRADGVAFSAIARRLRWSHSTTRQRLGLRLYLGEPGLLPAIVTRAEWDAANRARTVQPVPPGDTTRDLLLQGIARCAGCGHTLKVVCRPRADGTRVRAYYCKNASSDPCPDRAYVHTDVLDAHVEQWFTDAIATVPRLVDVAAATHELEQAQAAVAEAEAEMRGYVTVASALDPALFREGLDVRKARVEAAHELAAALSVPAARLPGGGPLATIWGSFGRSERREVLQGFLDSVVVRRGASGGLTGHVDIVWSDGTVADAEGSVRVLAA